MLNSILWDRNITKEVKLQTYNSIVRSTVTYGAEIWKLNKKITSKLMSMEMDFLRRSARHSKKNKKKKKQIAPRMKVLHDRLFLWVSTR